MWYAYVAGSVKSGQWNLAKNARVIYVRGDVTNSTMVFDGDVNCLYVMGVMADSKVDIKGAALKIYVRGGVTASELNVDGNLNVLYLINDVTDSTITVGGNMIKMYVVGDLQAGAIDIGGNATIVYVLGDATNSTLYVAGDMVSLYVRGNMTDSTLGVGGDMVSLYVRGNMTDSTLGVDGDTRIMKISGWLTRSKITTPGNITYVYLGAMRDSTVFAGVRTDYDTDVNADGVADLPTMGDLTDGSVSVITRFYILGVAGGGDFMINSNIAAHRFGYVSLRSPQLDNGGETFGVLSGEDGITGMRVFCNNMYYYWRNHAWVPALDALDLTVVDTV